MLPFGVPLEMPAMKWSFFLVLNQARAKPELQAYALLHSDSIEPMTILKSKEV